MARLKERALAQSAKVMAPMLFSERNFGTLLYQAARRVGPKVGEKSAVENFARMWREDDPAALLIKRIFRQGNRRCKTQFVTNMLRRNLGLGAKKRGEILAREVCNECHPYPTHPGSESVVTTLCGALDQYASGVAEVLDPPWQSDFADKGFEPWSNL